MLDAFNWPEGVEHSESYGFLDAPPAVPFVEDDGD
jgi:hypothetical protein